MTKILVAPVIAASQRAFLPGLAWTKLGVAAALFGASPSGQAQSGKVFACVNKPVSPATPDLAPGSLTRGPVVKNRGSTPTVVDFDNSGFVGVDTGQLGPSPRAQLQK